MSKAVASSPLPGGEREGPAPLFGAWEGEGGLRHHTAARTTARARELRQSSADAERKLWNEVRGSRIDGFKFRRQVSIGRYIADFVCPARKLIVEVDGGQHTPEIDAIRTAFLESRGYRIIRFWNNEVLLNIDGVWKMIAAALSPPTTPTRAAPSGASLASPIKGEEGSC